MPTYLDKTASLIPFARQVICDKATEHPHSGAYNTVMTEGSYLCRRCGLALFRAHSQFSSGCGWPSFDGTIEDAVKQLPDADGRRIEILCNRCDAHLGHVFTGEHFTDKNVRHCVNAAAVDFVADETVLDTEEAIVAGGCFWGVDYYLRQIPGVLIVEVGYLGGEVSEPTYEQVCQGDTGHVEAVRVVFDAAKTNYSTVLKRFFEIHDPTQHNGQGPDIGFQYRSAVFYYNQAQHDCVMDLSHQLKANGYSVVTQIQPADVFWKAEDYHQDYYQKHPKTPYCHRVVDRFL
ncbi:MAG: bifunctional methionine sulfoxide reductase B/A protein [Legionellaceae bacterium]|nr:bifunctional methionine sulfoxide reductase B/A protein [Legionellaceae bacterium]